MSLRSFAGALAAGVLLFSVSAAGAGDSTCSPGKTKTVTYPVADLVIPLNQPSRKEVKTQEETLMRLIVSTVAPQTWNGVGGPGAIDYFPITMSLVVNQTSEVQEQVNDLLAALRRLQDNEVSIEVRFLTLATETMERLGIKEKEGSTPGMAVLDDTQVQLLIEVAQGDRRVNVMQAPKMTVFNGQPAMIDLSEKQTFVVGVDFEDKDGKQVPQPKTKTVTTGMQVSVLPVISADRTTVTMQLGINLGRADATLAFNRETAWSKKSVRTNDGPNEPRYSTLEVEKVLKLASGTSALLTGWTMQRQVRNMARPPIIGRIPYLGRIFTTFSDGQETEHTLVLVTPRVVVREEEERKLPMPTVEACANTAPAFQTCADPLVTRAVRHEETRRAHDVLYVNKQSFELTYQLENVGPSQVKGIEVWWTHGDGKWARYPDEVKPTGPVPITVQTDGRYGFTLVPVSGAGRCGKRPEAGDEPKVWVEVDRKAPTLEIYAPDRSGVEQGKETIGLSWKADDKNLKADSVYLYWAESKDGPWHLIARELKAEGKHECSCKALPCRCYLRATATDLAGNQCEVTTPTPVLIDLRVPEIRDVKVNVRR